MEFNSPSARQHDVGKRTASLANGGLGRGGGGAWRGKRNGAKRGRVEELGWGVGGWRKRKGRCRGCVGTVVEWLAGHEMTFFDR